MRINVHFQKETWNILYCISIVLLLLIPKQVSAQAPGESKEDFDKRMQWWDDSRLGLSIHWGSYAVLGGEWKGRDYGKDVGYSSTEWMYYRTGMSEKEYRKISKTFNPTKYNAEEWVKIAKNAGLKYIVLTAKHHDGFGLFDSKASDWNVMHYSKIKRDLLKEYIDACHKHGMKVGIYYSHEVDWFHHMRKVKDYDPVSDSYKKFVSTQLTELFTNYGQIDLIWFDFPQRKVHDDFNQMCADVVRKLQPNCIINGRIGSGLGDYETLGDRQIVDAGIPGYKETIMTMGWGWAYDYNDDFWKPASEIISMGSQSVCRGANFLINVGPTGEGTFPLQDQARLHQLGEWLKLNGEAIYKTSANPFKKEHHWGSISVSKYDNNVYLHLWNWNGGPITLNGLVSNVKTALFLDDKEKISFSQDKKDATVVLNLPIDNLSKNLRIVKLELDGKDFDLVKGPNYLPPKFEKIPSYLKITGTITKVDGISFEFTGRKTHYSYNGKEDKLEGHEVFSEELSTMSFILDDESRFRINKKGNISEKLNMTLEKGEKYHVVYDHNNSVKILIKLEK